MASDQHPPEVYLQRIASEMKTIRELVSTAVAATREAESEIPEKMRRFVMYMHDIHDISFMYHEVGQEAPTWVKREMERCDDRFRQLLDEANTDGGTFEKVRQEMAEDPNNRWNHTRQLSKPKEATNETGNG